MIDPLANQVAATLDVGGSLVDIAVGERSVWVASGADGVIRRIDPITLQVAETMTLDGDVSRLAVGQGSL